MTLEEIESKRKYYISLKEKIEELIDEEKRCEEVMNDKFTPNQERHEWRSDMYAARREINSLTEKVNEIEILANEVPFELPNIVLKKI